MWSLKNVNDSMHGYQRLFPHMGDLSEGVCWQPRYEYLFLDHWSHYQIIILLTLYSTPTSSIYSLTTIYLILLFHELTPATCVRTNFFLHIDQTKVAKLTSHLSLINQLFHKFYICWVPIILVITPLLLYLYPLFILLCPYCPHIVINVPHRIPLLLFLWLYIVIVRSTGLYCDSLDSYIQKGGFAI